MWRCCRLFFQIKVIFRSFGVPLQCTDPSQLLCIRTPKRTWRSWWTPFRSNSCWGLVEGSIKIYGKYKRTILQSWDPSPVQASWSVMELKDTKRLPKFFASSCSRGASQSTRFLDAHLQLFEALFWSWEVQLGRQRLDFVPNECWLGCCTGRNPAHSAGSGNTTPHIKGLRPGGRDGTWVFYVFYKMVTLAYCILNINPACIYIYYIEYIYIYIYIFMYIIVWSRFFAVSLVLLYIGSALGTQIYGYLAGYVKDSNSKDGKISAACGLGEHLVVHWDFPPVSLLSSSIRSASVAAPVEVRNDAVTIWPYDGTVDHRACAWACAK